MIGCKCGVLVGCTVRTEITLYAGVKRPPQTPTAVPDRRKVLSVFVGQVHIIVQFIQTLLRHPLEFGIHTAHIF